ncbi:MAG TPA: ABC transporter permease [Gaiellaceae bacterium]|nr:ABC transporter permease [Gaiellaceae bacterium]
MTARARGLSVLRGVAGQRFFAVLVLFIGLFVLFAVTQERFATSANIKALLTSAAILWVVAIGLTFVMLAGGFDLSVGSMLALTTIGLGAFVNDFGMPAGLAVLAALVLGVALGAFNGILVGQLGLSFLVVTLGTLILYRGVVNLWSDRKTEQVLSSFLDSLAFDSFLGLPYPVWLMAGTFAVALYVQRSTYFGRDVYAVGGNADAARLSGIKVNRTIIAVYAISGLLAGVAGVLQAARIGAASPQVGEAVLFDAAAAVLLGGTSFAGGIGGVGGTAVGVLFLATLQNGLSVAGIASFWQQILTGAILLVAVLLDRVQREGAGALFRRTGWRRATGARATEAQVPEGSEP